MNSRIFCVAVACYIGTTAAASAADVAIVGKAPSVLKTDWTGPYIGLALGAKLADTTWTTTQLSDPPSAFVGTAIFDSSSPADFAPFGARFGAFAGYNWQSVRWVYGIEADFAWADAKKTRAGIPGCAIGCVLGAPGPGNDSSAVRMTFDASLRARLGYLVMPDLLLYGTGGIAWQAIEASATCENTLTDPVCLNSPPFTAKTETNRKVLTGWTIGAGIERKITENWFLRGEYRFAQFETMRGVFWASQPVADPGADTLHYDIKVRTHIATFALAYRF